MGGGGIMQSVLLPKYYLRFGNQTFAKSGQSVTAFAICLQIYDGMNRVVCGVVEIPVARTAKVSV